LEHEWIDTTVVNGQRYFYYITSYDYGDPASLVSPTECNKSILFDRTTGDVESMTSNVVVVTPNAPSAGYKEAPSNVSIGLVEGYTTASMSLQVFDSPAIKDQNVYRVIFEDTVKMIEGYNKKQLVTENITLENIKDYARLGVDRISVGTMLTLSSQALDFSMKIAIRILSERFLSMIIFEDCFKISYPSSS